MPAGNHYSNALEANHTFHMMGVREHINGLHEGDAEATRRLLVKQHKVAKLRHGVTTDVHNALGCSFGKVANKVWMQTSARRVNNDHVCMGELHKPFGRAHFFQVELRERGVADSIDMCIDPCVRNGRCSHIHAMHVFGAGGKGEANSTGTAKQVQYHVIFTQSCGTRNLVIKHGRLLRVGLEEGVGGDAEGDATERLLNVGAVAGQQSLLAVFRDVGAGDAADVLQYAHDLREGGHDAMREWHQAVRHFARACDEVDHDFLLLVCIGCGADDEVTEVALIGLGVEGLEKEF